MDTMKERSRITNKMDKVSRESFLFNAFRFFYFSLIGKFFWNDGDRYEGEWKDGKRNGQGKKSALLNYLLIHHCSLL